MKQKLLMNRKDWVLLLLYIAIAAIIRFTNLGSKPPWADEWATLVFSLGNSFKTVPLDKVISSDYLPDEFTENTLSAYIQDKTEFDFYFGLISPQLAIYLDRQLSSIEKDDFQNWCLARGIGEDLVIDLDNLKYAYREAAKQKKALAICIS